MESDAIGCWRCGVALQQELFPIGREEVCPSCNADLHACKLCLFFNPSVSDACDEPVAVQVNNKERANFCDYFKATPGAFKGSGSVNAAASRAELDALFGLGEAPPTGEADPGRADLDRLFGLRDD